ncbi:MAG TPA: hypothetical protein VHM20_07095, partial [Gammaproteobacteria bacterium]|nr:hypothetical protein [Gammaproteobacteria bacterium]
MTTIKTFKFLKKSSELDDLYAEIYDKLIVNDKHYKFKIIMKKISTLHLDNNYFPIDDYINWGSSLYKKSIKDKSSVYVVCHQKYGQYSFFSGTLSSIKKILIKELN